MRTTIALIIRLFCLCVLTACNSGEEGAPTIGSPPSGAQNITVGSIVSSIAPIDISSELSHWITFGSEPQRFKVNIERVTSLTVIARGVGVQPRMYFSDEYLVGSCIVGQSSLTASSCIWSTNEDGDLFFTVAGPAGTQALVEVLIPQHHPPPTAPPAVQDMASVAFPYRISDGSWRDEAGNYGISEPHPFRIDSLTPGLNYRVLIESPDLDSNTWVADCLKFDVAIPSCIVSIADSHPFDPCELNDDGVYQCEAAASLDGKLFVAVEPIHGAQFAEFTFDLAPIDGVYTGYYEGSAEFPVDITGELPYTAGYGNTFSVSHYRMTGLTPGAVYKMSINRHGDFFDRTSILIGDGEPGYSRAFGQADAFGHALLVLNVDAGTFDVTISPAPINRGTQSFPVVIDAAQGEFVAEVGTGYSWYSIENLVPDSSYQISTSNRDVHSIVVHPNYGVDGLDSYVCSTSASHCVYPSSANGSILLRVMDNSTQWGGEVTIGWTLAP